VQGQVATSTSTIY